MEFSRRGVLQTLLTLPFGARLRADVAGEGLAAAADYERAWAWVRQLAPSERTRFKDPLVAPLDEELKQLLDRAGPALDAVRRGSLERRCVWADGAKPGSPGKGPHDTVAVIDTGKLLLVRARRQVAEGRPRESLDDAFAVARYGRHVGSVGLFISRLYQCSLEARTTEILARFLPGLERATLARLRELHSAMPPSITWPETIAAEWRFIEATLHGMLDQAASPLDAASLEQAGLDRAVAEFFIFRAGGDRPKLHALAVESRAAFVELGQVLDLPRERQPETLRALVERLRIANPLVHSLAESAEGTRWAIRRMELLWEMLWAGVAMVEGGPDRLRRTVDPYGNGPFVYRARGRGFELESALGREGRPPVVLRFGDVTR